MGFFDRFMSDRTREVDGNVHGNGERFEVLNSEGEIYPIDTGDPQCPFRGPGWRNVLAAASDQTLYVPAAVLYRNRDKNRIFAGYQVNFGHGVTGFLPRSRSGYYYPEERDATGKRLSVRVMQFYPYGAKQGHVVVEAAQLHGKDGVRMKVEPGCSIWGLAVDVIMGRFLVLELPSGNFGLASVKDAYRLTRVSTLEALTGRFYRSLVGSLYPDAPLGRATYMVSVGEVQEASSVQAHGRGRRSSFPRWRKTVLGRETSDQFRQPVQLGRGLSRQLSLWRN